MVDEQSNAHPAASASAGNQPKNRWWRPTVFDFTRRRLAADLEAWERDVAARVHLDPEGKRWHTEAASIAANARSHLDAGRLDEGWRLFALSRRTSVRGLTGAALESRRVALLLEGGQKLDGWRKGTLERLLNEAAVVPEPGLDDLSRAALVSEAQRVLDDEFDNRYLKLSISRTQIAWGFGYLLVLLPALAVVVRGYPLSDIRILTHPIELIAVLLVGAMGGAISSITTVSAASGGRIPELLGSTPIALLRPLLGAATGLAVVLLVSSGLIDQIAANGTELLGLAFIGGFSEQLLIRLASRMNG